MSVLPEVVEQRSASVEYGVPDIRFRQGNFANLDGRGACRISHRHREGTYVRDRRVSSGLYVDPIAVARLVDGGRQFVGVAEALAKESQWNRSPDPHAGERMDPLGDV